MSKDNLDKDAEKKNTPEDSTKNDLEEDLEDPSEDTPDDDEENSDEENFDQNQEEDMKDQESMGGENVTQDTPNKMGWGYIALIIVIVVVVLFGFKNKILGYFSGESKTKAPNVVGSKLASPNPVIPSSSKMQQSKSVQVQKADTMTKDDVNVIVKDFIMNNPEVIMKSIAKLEQKANEQKAKKSKEFLNKASDTLSDGKPFLGNKNGTIQIIEFFDYKCLHCRKVYPQLTKLINDYPDLKIALIPLPFMGAASTKAARFSLAVNNLYPDKFYSFHSSLIQSDIINDQVLSALIKKNGLDKSKVMEEADSDRVTNLINENLQIAQKAGVRGVPSFVINGQFIPGAMSYENFKELIDKAKASTNTNNVNK